MSFSLNNKTKVFDEGTKVLKLSDLKKGQWASVEYTKEGSQRSHSQSMSALPRKVST